MNHISNKIILLLCCIVFAVSTNQPDDIILPLLTAVTCSALEGYFTNRTARILLPLCYIVLCMFFAPALYFIPLIGYDLFLDDNQYMISLITLPIIIHYNSYSGIQFLLILILLFISYVLKRNAAQLQVLETKYKTLQDDATENAATLKESNRELLEKQDYEVNLATLNERNRIAREIHDNVGHLLSSSLLQIGALLAITKEPIIKENLTTVKDTLSGGMDSIRHSIHNLHEESLDLHASLQNLIKNFTFCKATLDYQIETDLPIKAKYSLVFIVKEALSNVMKHSNATSVSVSLIEHPGFYQMIIQDNGTKQKHTSSDSGMGVTSMYNRISGLDGTINVDRKNGYRIFISLPKRRT